MSKYNMLAEIFRREVEKHFAFLTTDYGFSAAQTIDAPGICAQIIVFKGKNLAIVLHFDRRDQWIDCKIARVINGKVLDGLFPDKDGNSTREYLITFLILKGVKGIRRAKIPNYSFAELIPIYIEEEARILKEYGRDEILADPPTAFLRDGKDVVGGFSRTSHERMLRRTPILRETHDRYAGRGEKMCKYRTLVKIFHREVEKQFAFLTTDYEFPAAQTSDDSGTYAEIIVFKGKNLAIELSLHRHEEEVKCRITRVINGKIREEYRLDKDGKLVRESLVPLLELKGVKGIQFAEPLEVRFKDGIPIYLAEYARILKQFGRDEILADSPSAFKRNGKDIIGGPPGAFM